MRKQLYILTMLVLLIGCKEYEAPELEPETDPIFFFEGSVSGKTVSVAADGTYKAYSGFEADSLGIMQYNGSLSTCPSCESAFQLTWRADDQNNPSLTNTVMDNHPKIRFIQGMDSILFYDVELMADVLDGATSYSWTALGETYTTPTVSLSVSSEEMTRFPVTLEVSYDNGCSASIIDTVYLPNHGCDCKVKARQLDSLLFEFKAYGEGGATYEYVWNFESGEAIPSREVTYQYPELPSDGVDEILLQVNTGDCRASRRYNQYFESTSTGCAVNMNYSIQEVYKFQPSGAGIDLGEVELTYTDETGEIFYSLLVEQDDQSYFKVTEVEEYRDAFINTDERSMKVDAEFNCLMSNGKKTIRIEDGHLVLPIGLGAD